MPDRTGALHAREPAGFTCFLPSPGVIILSMPILSAGASILVSGASRQHIDNQQRHRNREDHF
jgi:hypothetical protein